MNHPLPRGWQEKKLIDFSPLQRGFDLPNSKIINGEYPIVYSNGIKAYHNEYKCKGVGVVTGRSGTIGKVTYVEKDYWPHNTSLWVTDFKGNLPKFVFYLLSYIDLSKYDAGTSVPTLNRNDVHKITVLVPPLDEQNRIADILSTFDDLIENLTKLIEKKEIYKKGVMQRVLSGEVRFNGFKDEWKEVKLSDICKSIKTGKLDANAMEENGKYRFYTCAKEYYKINTYAFDGEALLISGNGAYVGYIHYYNGKFNAYQRTYVLMDFTENIIYVKYYLDKYLKNRIKKEKNEGNTPYIVLNTLTDMKIKLPSLEEQNKIAELLTLIDKDIEILKQLLHLRKLQKKGLMQKLLTGEVRI